VIGIVLVQEGGGAGTWQRINGNFLPVSTTMGSALFNNHSIFGGIRDETIDGQAMVRVPKFYIQTGTVPSGKPNAGKRFWMVPVSQRCSAL
jgi:hypothetical protein